LDTRLNDWSLSIAISKISVAVGYNVWPGGVVVRRLDLRLKRSQVRILAVTLSGSNLRKAVHTRMPLSPSSISW